ncbi:hypothetical protein MH1LPH_12970 [Lactiplantibacillus brownii]
MPLVFWTLVLAVLFHTTVTTMFYGLFGTFVVLWLLRVVLMISLLGLAYRFGKKRCRN